jgi:hypothetical protein
VVDHRVGAQLRDERRLRASWSAAAWCRGGLVSRRVTAQVPVRVDYELTALGRGFAPLMFAIKEWSQEHIAEIEVARTAFQARVAE